MTNDKPAILACDIIIELAIRDLKNDYVIFFHEEWYRHNNVATYSFFSKLEDIQDRRFDQHYKKNFLAFTPKQRIALKSVMAEVSAIIPFTFIEEKAKDKYEKSNIIFWNYKITGKDDSKYSGFTFLPLDYSLSNNNHVSIMINKLDKFIAPTDTTNKKSPLMQTLRHELLHALGLGHPYDHDVTTRKHTVMSYSPVWFGNIPENSSSFQKFDILTLQTFYGQNKETRKGNTYYYLSLDDQNEHQTIWDAGGQDTVDLSQNKKAVQIFDMRDCQFSHTGHSRKDLPLWKNFSFAYTSILENYIGTDKHNFLFLNSADNIINGGNDHDYIFINDKDVITTIDHQEEHLYDKIEENVTHTGWGHDIYYSSGGYDHFFFDVENPGKMEFKIVKDNMIVSYETIDKEKKKKIISTFQVTNFNPKKNIFIFRVTNNKAARIIRKKFKAQIANAKKFVDQKHIENRTHFCRYNINEFDEKVAAITHQPMVKTKEWIALAF